MRVLFITRKYPPQVGGMENLSYHITTGVNCDKKIIALKKPNIHLIWFVPYALLYTLFTLHRWDVIHLGDPVLSIIGYTAKLFSPRKPVAVTVHGLDVTFENSIYQKYLDWFGKRFDSYICISRYSREMAQAIGISRTTIIPVGIDVEKFEGVKADKKTFHQKYNIPEDHQVMITVGRLVRRKGVLWFVENVLPKLKDKKATYLIIGDGPDKDAINKAIREKGLAGKARLLGRVPDDELKYIYVNADMFIMPNIPIQGDMEGFGIVAIEASLAGLVLIASDLEGIQDAVTDGVNGILIPPGDAEKYIETIEDVLEDYPKYITFKDKAKEYTRATYSWDKICNSYLDEFKRLSEVVR